MHSFLQLSWVRGTWNTPLLTSFSGKTSGSGKLSQTGRHVAEMRFASFFLCDLSGPVRWQNVVYRNQEALMYRAGPTCTSQLAVSLRFLPDSPFLTDLTPQQRRMYHQRIFLCSSIYQNAWKLTSCYWARPITSPPRPAADGLLTKRSLAQERGMGHNPQQAAKAPTASKPDCNQARKFSRSTLWLFSHVEWRGARHRKSMLKRGQAQGTAPQQSSAQPSRHSTHIRGHFLKYANSSVADNCLVLREASAEKLWGF